MADPIDLNPAKGLQSAGGIQSGLKGLKTRQSEKDTPQMLEKACKDFESIFIDHMMREMRKTIPQDGLLDGGQAEQLYTGMLDTEMAKSISSQGGMGLASVLYRQLSTLAEKE